jgi:hypothetical protein
MIRTLRLRRIAAFGLALALAGSGTAAAQSARPALRASVTVQGDLVRIGDLVENAGPVANVAIFRAPDLGTTGAVATDRIVDAIRPYQLIDIDTRGLSEVSVARAGPSRSMRFPTASPRRCPGNTSSASRTISGSPSIARCARSRSKPKPRANCRCWRSITMRGPTDSTSRSTFLPARACIASRCGSPVRRPKPST